MKAHAGKQAKELTLEFTVTYHCETRMLERHISRDWLIETLDNPQKSLASDDGRMHVFRRIAEYGNRWLHVVVDINESPQRVLTAYFDRGME